MRRGMLIVRQIKLRAASLLVAPKRQLNIQDVQKLRLRAVPRCLVVSKFDRSGFELEEDFAVALFSHPAPYFVVNVFPKRTAAR